MRRAKGDVLTDAVRATDLPALIANHFPDSGCVPGKPGVFFAAWRGNTETPALSLTRKDGVWLWHDMATGEGGNAFDFLVVTLKMTRQEAAHTLLSLHSLDESMPSGKAGQSTLRPIPPEASRAFERPESQRIPAMAGRGFTPALLSEYGITTDNGQDALIPITSPEGVILQVKRRLAKPTKSKYMYEYKGHGGPAWCSPNSRDAPVLLVVEGELNGIIAHASLVEAGETSIGVMGVAGAKNDLYPGLCYGKRVFIYADDDDAGEEAKRAWSEAARADGARSVHIIPANDMDFCDFAGKHGRVELAQLLDAMRHAAVQRFGAADRMLGTYTVRELLNSADRYFNGGVIHATGIRQMDRETGGIRESGVYGIAALPSIGKSALLRRFLLEHVRAGGTVRLYSPDQSPKAIYRLTAGLLANVGVHEARTRRFHEDTLKHHGSPENAMKALREAYEHILLELGDRFQVSEEGSVTAIIEDMRRARDQGVTMFGVDYIQLIEPAEWNDKDGKVVKDLQVLSSELRAPILTAMQLAKYKFPPSRKSGIPMASDIEGSGAYFQASEMVMMLYNESVYRRKYAGPDVELLGDGDHEARLMLTKDKEGDGNLEFMLLWVPRLVTYRDPSMWKPEQEREGLM